VSCSSLLVMTSMSIKFIFISLALFFKFFLVRIEYKVPLTCVLTTIFSCSIRSDRTDSTRFKSIYSHLFFPEILRLRFISKAVVYSRLYSDNLVLSFSNVLNIQLITLSSIIIVWASLRKENFYNAPRAF
jgi:hypothetical protein